MSIYSLVIYSAINLYLLFTQTPYTDPVSYTHLAVYKRQYIYIANISIQWFLKHRFKLFQGSLQFAKVLRYRDLILNKISRCLSKISGPKIVYLTLIFTIL